MKPVLDVACGSRMFYTDKNTDQVLFVDKRRHYEELNSGHIINVDPDVQADFRDLPFDDDSFYHVVFDPPHLIQAGDNSWLAKKYGKLPKDEWATYIKEGFDEAYRVLKPYGTLVFKWNEDQISNRQIIDAIGKEPLYMQKRAKTHWMVFIKNKNIEENA